MHPSAATPSRRLRNSGVAKVPRTAIFPAAARVAVRTPIRIQIRTLIPIPTLGRGRSWGRTDMLRATVLILLAAAPLLRASATVTSLTPQARNVQELAARLADEDPAKRAAAACALRKEGDLAADAIPQLVALLGDP